MKKNTEEKMVQKRRVVITGLGAVTPIGNTVPEFWTNVRKGTVGIGEITGFDTKDFKVKLAAQVKDFHGEEKMDAKAARRMELFSQYAVAAAKEALEDAGLDLTKEDLFRAGVIVGSGIGSLSTIEKEYTKILEGRANRVDPLMVPRMISNMAAGNISIQLGIRGKCTNVVTACASGTNCIGDAFRTIQYGDAEIMFAGGAESCICPTGIAGFQALTALSQETDPLRASIPFDVDRKGFVLGEGAGILVLEELEHARKRSARIYAELVGYGATGDAFHITSPCEDGSGAARAMELAMQEAETEPDQIGYINAHGTGTHHNDLFETRAIKRAFGEAAKQVSVNSTKSMIGHLLGAAGAVEAIVCVKTLQEGFIHQTVGTKETDAECDLDYTIGAPKQKKLDYAMSNSLGFGGHNATILMKRYEEGYEGVTDMELEQIAELIDRVSASELDSFCLEQNGMRLSLKKKQPRKQTDPETQSTLVQLQKQSESPQEQSKQMSPVELTGTEPTKTEHTKTVVSPLVGIFYAAPAEDAEPFVQEGDGIEKGQTLGIVEAMKLMNELESDYCGTVKQILVSNGEMVEYGQPLFIVEEQN